LADPSKLSFFCGTDFFSGFLSFDVPFDDALPFISNQLLKNGSPKWLSSTVCLIASGLFP